MLDPERRAEAARLQDEAREKLGHLVNHDAAKSKYLFGVNREQFALSQLSALSGDASEEATARRLTISLQLAEGLSLQCRYEEARYVAKGIDAQAEAKYAQRAAAVESLGVKRCLCPPFVMKPSPTDAKGEKVVNERPIELMFDGEKHITILKCDSCGTISARA